MIEFTGENARAVVSLLASAQDLMTRLATGWEGDEPEEIAEMRSWLAAFRKAEPRLFPLADAVATAMEPSTTGRRAELTEHGVEHLDLKGEAG